MKNARTETTTAHNETLGELTKACRNLADKADAMLDYMCHREPDNQERQLEEAVEQARNAIKKAKGESP